VRLSVRCVSALIVTVLAWTLATAQVILRLDLPAQPLADSLRAVASQTNINILFDAPLVAGRRAPALKAQLTVEAALTRLLTGTGIKHEFLNESTVVLAPADSGSKGNLSDTQRRSL